MTAGASSARSSGFVDPTGRRPIFLLAAAAGRGPGDDMSLYGAGRRVAVTWASRGHERGRIEVEDIGEGEVVALRREDAAPHVTVRLGGHDLLLQGGPSPADPAWFTLVDDAGYTVARADAARLSGAGSRRAPEDWTVRPARGPALRLRHRPGAAVVPRVTLLDEAGTPWWVRDGRLAGCPTTSTRRRRCSPSCWSTSSAAPRWSPLRDPRVSAKWRR